MTLNGDTTGADSSAVDRVERHQQERYAVIGGRFAARCSCGWQSERTYPTAGMAGTVFDEHRERLLDALRVLRP